MAPIPDNIALILAAGKGTRMRSPKPKVLHTLLGAPMLAYILEAIKPVFGKHILLVSGYKAVELEAVFPELHFVRQEEQLGTGHALKLALPALAKSGAKLVTVINGDAPLITSADITAFLSKAAGADIAFATITLPDPGPYGRVVRNGDKLAGIIEAKDFDASKHGSATGEVNAGLYCLSLEACRQLIPKLNNGNKSGEYYITDLVQLGIEAGFNVRGIACGSDLNFLGINSPLELAEAENNLAMRTAKELMLNGVIIHMPQAARISPFVKIEPGVEIACPCRIYGATTIAAGAYIDSMCVIQDSEIAAGAQIKPFSHLEAAKVGPGAIVGPYTRLRPGAILEENSHAGNFVELKKATLGKGAKANHLSYLGDAEIGAGTNIGAGTITCNYDGKNKHQTKIGDKAFIGSNTAIVAPVAIGNGALIGAGSVITKDVPADDLAIARSRQQNLKRKK